MVDCRACSNFLLDGHDSSLSNRRNFVVKPSSGEVVCLSCGAVKVSKILDLGGEWRSYADDSKRCSNIRVNGVGQIQLLSVLKKRLKSSGTWARGSNGSKRIRRLKWSSYQDCKRCTGMSYTCSYYLNRVAALEARAYISRLVPVPA